MKNFRIIKCIFMIEEDRGSIMDLHNFYSGNEWEAYKYFGAHVEKQGVTFRVYAPSAKKVTIIGEFNYWHDTTLECLGRGGIYSVFIPNAKVGQMYKYRIYHHDNSVTDKADPYGYGMELRPCTASIIRDLQAFAFTDHDWMKQMDKGYCRPINIYELHFGSFKANGNKWYRYEELAEVLIPYLKEMGYTHVEIMPLNEHPLDESWGYQSTGFYAPTARYGTCDGLKSFINTCHHSGIGVILDFVMVHFAIDDYGLAKFDGTPLYEISSDDSNQSEWGSYQFAYEKGEVSSFLKSCANYWLEEYHFDGLRFDAVSNMIYWHGKKECGTNEGALQFVRSLNQGLHQRHPKALLIAEDSTNYLKVTAPVEYDGLGFDYKWDLGFMNDTLRFFQYSVDERKMHYQDLLFSMHYFYNELYLLPFSHDEVVHGKKTILDKMQGDYEEKFAQCRAMYIYMYTHPGKKLNFMGNEIGQFREWSEYRPQDFDVLSKFSMHQMFKRFCRDLNRIYLSHAALYETEYNSSNFRYIISNRSNDLVYAFMRESNDEKIFVIFNFSNQEYMDYTILINGNHKLIEIMNSESAIYGGNYQNPNQEIFIRNNLCKLSLKPYSARLFVLE